MSVQNISNMYSYNFGYCVSSIDSEEKEIMQRLLAHGITPTGNKTADKAKLRKIEEESAKQENIVSNKYLTVSTSEQESIQENKRNKRKNSNPEQSVNFSDKRVGAKAFGEQVFLAINMKNNTAQKRTKLFSDDSKEVSL